jgi:hypothetical protein
VGQTPVLVEEQVLRWGPVLGLGLKGEEEQAFLAA